MAGYHRRGCVWLEIRKWDRRSGGVSPQLVIVLNTQLAMLGNLFAVLHVITGECLLAKTAPYWY